MKDFHIFHKWSKWEQYKWQGTVYILGKACEASERRQKRYCETCNKEQDELVKKG